MIRSKFRSTANNIRRAYRLLRFLNVFDACRIIIAEWFRVKSRITITIFETPFTLRTHTSDIPVLMECLVRGEFCALDVENVMTIIDAGANIGASSIAFAKRYPLARVIAIEPERDNFDILKFNTQSYPNIELVRGALLAEAGEVSLFSRGTGPWGFSVVRGNLLQAKEFHEQVVAISVTDVVQSFNLTGIDILKMDIEGAECEVFEHAGPWLDHVRVIIVELHDRIVPGCSRAYERATSDFSIQMQRGEKRIAIRK